MAIFTNKEKYKWDFVNLGGSSRVRISSGEDIAHLAELDPKMWTVLSCPVTGLEIDDKSLAYMDADGDGKIRVNDVISVSQWVTGMLKNTDLLLEGKDSIDIENIDQESPAGKKLYNSAKHILENLGKEGSVITLADTSDVAVIFAKTRFNGDGVITETTSDDADDKAVITAAIAAFGGVADRSGATGIDAPMIEAFYKALADYMAWKEAEVEAPLGDKTDALIDAYNALDAKVKDFFVRSKLAAFSPDSTASLDVQTSSIQAISTENLTGKTDEIASYPIARITGKAEIDLSAPINPAWSAKFNLVKEVAFKDKKVLTEADWAELGASFGPYVSWKGAKAGACVEPLGIDKVKEFLAKDRKAVLLDFVSQDAAVAEEAANIDMVNKFLHIFRDFYRLLRNFVTFEDFYDKDQNVTAIFQSGRLIIDQRECRFCMNVADAAKHNASAATSGMFLVYCDCTTKVKAGKISIVAAVTVGDIGDLIVGKNAVYYDNDGVEWDAVITKIVDNPISVSQAFWSPYRRMAKAVENLINKSAADKDAKVMADATAKINAMPAKGTDAAPAQPQPFDIGKFAGIFAALGMAVGTLATALTNIFDGLLNMPPWKTLIALVSVILAISGPAMVLAWLKLRRRNIAPLLNANGWAVNAASKISIPFGETLTDAAKYPKMKLKDPYAKKGIPTWKKYLISFSVLVVAVGVLWIFNLLSWAGLDSPLPRYNQPEPAAVEVVVETPAETPAETVAE